MKIIFNKFSLWDSLALKDNIFNEILLYKSIRTKNINKSDHSKIYTLVLKYNSKLSIQHYQAILENQFGIHKKYISTYIKKLLHDKKIIWQHLSLSMIKALDYEIQEYLKSKNLKNNIIKTIKEHAI